MRDRSRGEEKTMAEYIVRETGYPMATKQEVVGELVRCRECEWYKTNYSWNGKEHKVCGIEPFEPIRREEDYCSYAERKE